jgi:UDP-N-acetylglucosamine 2-epimerase (non-hydrolysing)
MFDYAPLGPSVLDGVSNRPSAKILVLFGTRPEAIKLAPVIHELCNRGFNTVVVSSSQHKQLLRPFLKTLNVKVDHDLRIMKQSQSLNDVCSRVIAKLDKVLAAEEPDLIIVQGDTTTALAGALAGFNRKVAVGHVEAGLRSGNLMSPFPEEMNRRLISQAATLHFAATELNRLNLHAEGVAEDHVYVTGNPVVDSLSFMLKNLQVDRSTTELIASTQGTKRILLTTHRRESFGESMRENLRVLARFVSEHEDVCLMFPVHPNPNVQAAAQDILGGQERIHLLAPLGYSDFLALMRSSWIIVSDSGGVQEEAPSMGKPLLILRENTERPEAVMAGAAKLVGDRAEALQHLLEESYADNTWAAGVRQMANPFGDGKASYRIANAVEQHFSIQTPRTVAAAMSAI